ncbi:hypothetical protein [Colwellia sp. MT41]|nr:hypothetical protein [Colwellia sp. MT41]
MAKIYIDQVCGISTDFHEAYPTTAALTFMKLTQLQQQGNFNHGTT